MKSPPSKTFGGTGTEASVPEAGERTPLGISTPEGGDRVGDVGSKVDGVAEEGDGDVAKLGDGVVGGNTMLNSS